MTSTGSEERERMSLRLEHITYAKHQPFETNVREFLFDVFYDVNGGASAIVKDATKGGWCRTNVSCEHLLGHVLRLHNLSDSVLHLLIKWFWAPRGAFYIQFTKVNQKIEPCKFLKRNL